MSGSSTQLIAFEIQTDQSAVYVPNDAPTEKSPVILQQHPPLRKMPTSLYMIEQELRDTSMVLTVYRVEQEEEGRARKPYLELFLPLDGDISPELTILTGIEKATFTSGYTDDKKCTLILNR